MPRGSHKAVHSLVGGGLREEGGALAWRLPGRWTTSICDWRRCLGKSWGSRRKKGSNTHALKQIGIRQEGTCSSWELPGAWWGGTEDRAVSRSGRRTESLLHFARLFALSLNDEEYSAFLAVAVRASCLASLSYPHFLVGDR